MSGVQRIAISTNGSMPLDQYMELINYGVNDYSVSLDACCAADCGAMSGTNGCKFNNIETNIRELSKVTYVTVGVVLTDDNAPNLQTLWSTPTAWALPTSESYRPPSKGR